MRIADILSTAAVRSQAQATSKKRLFHDLAEMAAQAYGVNAAQTLDALQERESLGATGVVTGAALLALRFVPQFGWAEGLYQAAYHSVSAYNNAGFVVMPGGMGQYAQDPLVSGPAETASTPSRWAMTSPVATVSAPARTASVASERMEAVRSGSMPSRQSASEARTSSRARTLRIA